MYFVAKDRASSLGSLLQYGTGGQMTWGVYDARGDVPGWRRTALPRLRANGNRGALRRVVAAAAQRDDAAEDEDQGSAPHHPILGGAADVRGGPCAADAPPL